MSAADVATQSAADDPSPAPTGRDALKAVMDRPRAAGLEEAGDDRDPCARKEDGRRHQMQHRYYY